MAKLLATAIGVVSALLLNCQPPSSVPAREPHAAEPRANDLDEEAVKAMSHALLDAFDRADEPAFTSVLGATFALFQEGHLLDVDVALRDIRQRREGHAVARSKTYKKELVKVSSGAAVFIGNAVDHFVAAGDRPAVDVDGWTTLVWVREGARWKVAHWQWEKAGDDREREMWNSTYRSGRGFNPKPNAFLVEITKGRTPGTALDVAMGQGRNSIHLATHGWHVTGFDIAEEGLRIARQTAADHDLSIDIRNARVESWDFGIAKWDLIAFIYASDVDLLKRSVQALKPGGVVIVEGFHKDAPRSPRAAGFAAGEIAAIYKDGFRVLRDEVVEDLPDWGDARTKLVRFAAEKR